MSAFDLGIGCIFIGVVLNVWLYGFSCVQAYIYFVRFKSDRQFMRMFVGFLFCADTINSILDVVFLYKYLITNFGNLHYASIANNEFATDPLCVQIVGFATQMFFAWRIWKLIPGRWNWLPPLIICILGFMSFLGALGTTIGVVIIRHFENFQKFEQTVALWLSCTAAADIMVTISLITTLHKSRTGFSQTDDLLTKLIRGTLQTGLLTTSFAVIDLILFVSSTSTLHLVFNLPLSKLYINSLLSTLNARAFITQAGQTVNHIGNTSFLGSPIHGVSNLSNIKLAEAGMSSTVSSNFGGLGDNKKEECEIVLSATPMLADTHQNQICNELTSPTTTTTRSPPATSRPSYDKRSRAKNLFNNAWKRNETKRFEGGDELGMGKSTFTNSTEEGVHVTTVQERFEGGDELGMGKSTFTNSTEEGVHVTTVQERFESDLPKSLKSSLPPALSFSNFNNKSMASFVTDSQRSMKSPQIEDHGEEIDNANPKYSNIQSNSSNHTNHVDDTIEDEIHHHHHQQQEGIDSMQMQIVQSRAENVTDNKNNKQQREGIDSMQMQIVQSRAENVTDNKNNKQQRESMVSRHPYSQC